MPQKQFILALALGILAGALACFGILYTKSKKKGQLIIPPENVFVSSSPYIFGIDISHYQGRIDWEEVRTSHHPIEYVFMRSTMGSNGKDNEFKRNWKGAKKQGYHRGAYHYFRPNESGKNQFENFKNSVVLEKGDLPPVLDIEKQSRKGNKYMVGEVKKWLKAAEDHYEVKPIIYTGHTFYKHFLKGEVDGYPLWIANYNPNSKHKIKEEEWRFHQFTEKVRVKGIRATVDGNDFDGTTQELLSLVIQ
jgi:GH25 family lysozyme M1 (1,4-beta-N-acetylmuramidase)